MSYRQMHLNKSGSGMAARTACGRNIIRTPPEVQLAIGRLFLMLSRPEQPGDIETFHEIRSIVLDSSEQQTPDHRPNYVAQRMTGAQGDFA